MMARQGIDSSKTVAWPQFSIKGTPRAKLPASRVGEFIPE
jgi:hypothetical protein